MSAVFDFFVAAWPLILVAGLAYLFIRGARGARRDRPSAATEHETGAWARSEWSARRGDMADGDGGGD